MITRIKLTCDDLPLCSEGKDGFVKSLNTKIGKSGGEHVKVKEKRHEQTAYKRKNGKSSTYPVSLSIQVVVYSNHKTRRNGGFVAKERVWFTLIFQFN